MYDTDKKSRFTAKKGFSYWHKINEKILKHKNMNSEFENGASSSNKRSSMMT